MLNLEQRLRTQLDAFSTRSAVEANSRGDGAIISDAHCSSLPAQQRHENLAQVRTASMVTYSHTGGALQMGNHAVRCIRAPRQALIIDRFHSNG
jgi:hypothetical protein